MKKDLNYFLFKKEVLKKEGSKGTFFRFQNDLAKAIVEAPGPYNDKDVKSVRPYLNQVLKSGGAPYEKPMSENLKKQILKILKINLSKEDELYSVLEEEFVKAYNHLKQVEKVEQPFKFDENYENFITWGLKANKLVALMNEPGEIFWSPNTNTKNDIDFVLNRLFEVIFKNFKGNEDEIVKSLKEEDLSLTRITTDLNSFNCSFYLPNYTTGIDFWKSLFCFFCEEKLYETTLDDRDKIRIASNFFKLINSSENALINVYKVAPHLVVVPLIFFQSENYIETLKKTSSKEELFVLSLDKGVLKNVHTLPDPNKKIWKEEVYYHLKNNSSSNKYNVQNITFSNYISDVIGALV